MVDMNTADNGFGRFPELGGFRGKAAWDWIALAPDNAANLTVDTVAIEGLERTFDGWLKAQNDAGYGHAVNDATAEDSGAGTFVWIGMLGNALYRVWMVSPPFSGDECDATATMTRWTGDAVLLEDKLKAETRAHQISVAQEALNTLFTYSAPEVLNEALASCVNRGGETARAWALAMRQAGEAALK